MCGMCVAVAVGINIPGQKTKMLYLITVMVQSSTCECPESYMKLCAYILKAELVCNVLVWKLAVSSPFCVPSVLGLSVG